MKPTSLISLTIVVGIALVAAVCFTARTQSSQGASIPASGQRYTIICGSSGQFNETYVLDTQNGRVWMMRGQVSASPGLVPCWYQLLDGHTSLSPIDGDREIETAKQARQSESSPAAAPKSTEEIKKQLDEDANKLFPK